MVTRHRPHMPAIHRRVAVARYAIRGSSTRSRFVRKRNANVTGEWNSEGGVYELLAQGERNRK